MTLRESRKSHSAHGRGASTSKSRSQSKRYLQSEERIQNRTPPYHKRKFTYSIIIPYVSALECDTTAPKKRTDEYGRTSQHRQNQPRPGALNFRLVLVFTRLPVLPALSSICSVHASRRSCQDLSPSLSVPISRPPRFIPSFSTSIGWSDLFRDRHSGMRS